MRTQTKASTTPTTPSCGLCAGVLRWLFRQRTQRATSRSCSCCASAGGTCKKSTSEVSACNYCKGTYCSLWTGPPGLCCSYYCTRHRRMAGWAARCILYDGHSSSLGQGPTRLARFRVVVINAAAVVGRFRPADTRRRRHLDARLLPPRRERADAVELSVELFRAARGAAATAHEEGAGGQHRHAAHDRDPNGEALLLPVLLLIAPFLARWRTGRVRRSRTGRIRRTLRRLGGRLRGRDVHAARAVACHRMAEH